MIPYEQETVTSLYVKTNQKDILLLGIGVIGRRIINLIKKHQDDIGRKTFIVKNELLRDFKIKPSSEFDVKCTLILTNAAEKEKHKLQTYQNFFEALPFLYKRQWYSSLSGM